MQPSERNAAYLWDMLEAARLARDYVQGVTLQAYLEDRKLQLAIERLIEIIGEAAGGVSSDFKDSHPEVPCRQIIVQRHVLAHEYGEIKHDRIWIVATKHLPPLITQLESLLPPPGTE